jgi:hypothetical protein
MRFTKIKWNGMRVSLEWIDKKGKTEVEHHLNSYDVPAPALEKSLSAFVPIALDLLELPQSYRNDLRVTGLSTNEEDDERAGLVITLQKKIKQANAPLVLNTPHLREPVAPAEYGAVGFFTNGMSEAIDKAQVAAIDYHNGKRAQVDAFEDPPKEKADEPTISINGGPDFPASTVKKALEIVKRSNKKPRKKK